MEEETRNDAPTQKASAATSSNLGATLLRVAWLAILLGMAMEGTLLLLSAGFGNFLGLKSLVADLARNVSWSLLVCVGLSVGTAVQKARVPVMGFLGFLAAPAALEISRVVHKGAIQALAISGSAGEDLSPFLLALIKGLEYGCRAGARLGESAPVGRGGCPHGSWVRRGLDIWRSRNSPPGRIGPGGVRHYSRASGRYRGPLPGRLLAGSFLGGSIRNQYGERRMNLGRIQV